MDHVFATPTFQVGEINSITVPVGENRLKLPEVPQRLMQVPQGPLMALKR